MKRKWLGLQLLVVCGPLCAMEPKTATEMDAFAKAKVGELDQLLNRIPTNHGLAAGIAHLQSIVNYAEGYAKKVVASCAAHDALMTVATDAKNLIACYEEEASLMVLKSEPAIRRRDRSPIARPSSPVPSGFFVDTATLEDEALALSDTYSSAAPKKVANASIKKRSICSLSQRQAQEYAEAEEFLQAQLKSLESCADSPEVQQILSEIISQANDYAQDSQIYTDISERFQDIVARAQKMQQNFNISEWL